MTNNKNTLGTFFVSILLLLATACNLPGGAIPASGAAAHQTVKPATPLPSTYTLPATQTMVSATPLAPTATITATSVPPDLPFVIDCSALAADRQPACDAYLAYTRDKVYPILRDVTGVSLSKCYKKITYTIVPHLENGELGGLSGGADITYAAEVSIESSIPFDVHELIHSISKCSGALDFHVFHKLLMNYVYDQLNDPRSGAYVVQNESQTTNFQRQLLNDVKTATGQDLDLKCFGILANQVEMTYFQKGDKASIQRLYRSSIPPLHLDKQPNATLISIYDDVPVARQVEAVLEMLKKEYNDSINAPTCGY